ncbi:ecf RNA polymerase sigma factor-anti-sigma complex [Caudoviricetes sp.]|nr:ecf RNA polymerase sigma factor-anti-sigma complex [Caudoviricetes sp.]
MLKPHAPSSPYLNPVCHFYFQARDPEGNSTFFFTIGYAALYAGHRFITQLLEDLEDCETHWLDNDQLLITHTPTLSTLTIKGELEDAIEYNPSKEEAAWTIPHPDTQSLRRATMFYLTPTTVDRSTSSTENEEPSKPKPQAPKRHKTTKPPSSSDQITVAQIAEELNIAPNKARNILRKAEIQKPEQGWTFNTNDPIIETIRKLLSAG